jgi:hypothetical protein
MPHLSFTMTVLPVSSFRKGLGFTGTACRVKRTKHSNRSAADSGPPGNHTQKKTGQQQHLSFTMTVLPVSLFRKGLGFTGTACRVQQSA